MRRALYCAALVALCATAARAQQPEGSIDLSSLDRLAPLAAEALVRTDKTPDGKGTVYVREFEFKQAGAYRESDLAAVREQLRAPGWSRTMAVEEREGPGGEERFEMYVYTRKVGARVHAGLLIINTEPTEVTVVNVVGEGDARKLMEKIRRGVTKKQ